MKKIISIRSWVVKLLILILIIISVAIFLFLFHPEYFINDLESIIEENISSIISEEFSIGKFEGNFIEGFTLRNVRYGAIDNIIFSAGEIYVDPDLSLLLFGNIVISEMKIHNSYFQYSLSHDEGTFPKSIHKYPLNFTITSLKIINSTILYNENIYYLDGRVELSNNNKLNTQFNKFTINSPLFDDRLIIQSGSMKFFNNRIILKNIYLDSSWISGKLDFTLNLNDISKSISEINLEKIRIHLWDYNDLLINNLTITTQDTMKLLIDRISYTNMLLNDIEIKGITYRDSIIMSYSFSYLENKYKGDGIISFGSMNWETLLKFNNFKLNDNTIFSGSLNIYSPYHFDPINITVDLQNTLINSIRFNSIAGTISIDQNNMVYGNLETISNGLIAKLNISKYFDKENYHINGLLHFNEFNLSSYFPSSIVSQFSGELDFNWRLTNNSGSLYSNTEFYRGNILNKKYNNIFNTTKLEINDGKYIGLSNGTISNFLLDPYKWKEISYGVNIFDSEISGIFLKAISELDDSLKIKANRQLLNNFYFSEFNGSLRGSDLTIEPFFVKIDMDKKHIVLPEIKAMINDGLVQLSGNYAHQLKYDLDVRLENIIFKDLYSIIGKPFPINGLIKRCQFRIENNNIIDDIKPLIFSHLSIYNGDLDGMVFDSLLLSTTFYDRRLVISKFNLHTAIGSTEADGWLNVGLFDSTLFTPQDNIHLYIYFDHFEIQKFNKYLPWEFDVDGLLTGNAEIKGAAENLEIIGNIGIENPKFDKIEGNYLSTAISYQKHRLFFNNLHLLTKKGKYSGFGNIPINLDITYTDPLIIGSLPIDFVFTGKTNSIEFIPRYFDVIDSVNGMDANDSSFIMILEIKGTISNPIRNGELIVNHGNLYIDHINNPIGNINGKIEIIDNTLIIDHLSGQLVNNRSNKQFSIPLFGRIKNMFNNQKGIIKNENLKLTGSVNLQDFFKPDFSLHLIGEDLFLESSYNLFTGYGSADLYITGQDSVFVHGNFQPNPHDFTITNYDESSNNYDESINTSVLYIYNINIPFEDGIEVKTDNANLFMDGDITISRIGTENLNYSGKINIIDGRYYDTQGNMFENISGNLFLSPDQSSSYIDIHANTQIPPSTIDVNIVGKPNNPQIFLSDIEGQYSQTELLSLLTFGSSEINLQDNISEVENIFSNYFENKIERSIAQMATLDEFQLSSSVPLLSNFDSQGDMEIKLIIGKRLSKKMYLNTHIDFYDFNDNQYVAEYRLSKNTSLVGGINLNDGNNSFHIKYRIKYYY